MKSITYNFDLLKPDMTRGILRAKGHDDEKISEIIVKLIKSAGDQKTRRYPNKVLSDFNKIAKLAVVSEKEVNESEHSLPPCGECGGTIFIPTGTCHACATCGASQGCS